MSDITTLANVAEIVGGIAILISLVYVGVQVRQSNRFARAENTRVLLDTSFIEPFDFEIIARAWNDYNSLQLSDRAHFHKYMMRLMNHYNLIFDTWKLGLTNDSLVTDWQLALSQIIATTGGNQWWHRGGSTTLSGGAAEALDAYREHHRHEITPYDQVMQALGSDS